MTLAHHFKRVLVRSLLSDRERQHLAQLEFADAGHGFDVLGLDPLSVAAAVGLCRFPYERYFRVRSHGVQNVPESGAAILVANHSGLLPIDAAMIVIDVLRHTSPPRVPRAIGDVFIPFMPWVGTFFSRVGMVSGSYSNFRHLLETGELVLVFPEGTPGIGKGFDKRYQLQAFRVGHAELALRLRVPVVPVGVVGAEESWPQLTRLDRFHAFGAPFLPIPATLLPMPVRCHIYYGKPLLLHERWAPEQADDPSTARRAAALVQREVAQLIARGLAQRKGLFR